MRVDDDVCVQRAEATVTRASRRELESVMKTSAQSASVLRRPSSAIVSQRRLIISLRARRN